MDRVLELVYRAARWVSWLAVAALGLMMLLTTADVVLRYFGFPIPGTFDVVRLCNLVAVAVPIAYTQAMKGHIAIEFIVEKFPGRAKFAIGAVNYAVNVVAYAFLAWQGVLYSLKLARVSVVSETIKIPLFPFSYVLAFALMFHAIVLLAQAAEYVWKGKGQWTA